ncbi:MAG: hypothetical protein D6739_07310 [Nitrospirae bacterium]|nr:MAG: hypothetical protein D6739_07310 [Nitrospirota bacterium]
MAAVVRCLLLLLLAAALPAAAAPSEAGPGAGLHELEERLAVQEQRIAALEERLAAAEAGEERFHWGAAPLRLQGYTSVAFERREGRPATFDQEEFSLYFNSGISDRVSVFAEVELLHDRRRTDPETGRAEDVGRVRLERALVDYHPSDRFQLRAGKFLTPFGDWNVNHADPLQFTTSVPLAVDSVFPESSTGLMVRGSLEAAGLEFAYRLWVANGRGRDPDRHDANFRKAYGARLIVEPRPGLELGLSLLDDADDRVEEAHERDFGLDLRWLWGGLEVKGEGVVSQASGGDSPGSPEGLFLQGAYTVGRLTPVVRGEWFRRRTARHAERRWVAGAAYRLLAPTLLKVEVQRTLGGDGPGGNTALLCSVATFF